MGMRNYLIEGVSGTGKSSVCGELRGSRNFSKFVDLFDGVFVLEADLDTVIRRLEERPEDDFGATQEQRDGVARLHRTKEDIPKNGVVIDATAPTACVVDEIVRRSEESPIS
jgi:thymidylate kinase